MLYRIDVLIAGQKIAICGNDCEAEVKAAARWLINYCGAAGNADDTINMPFGA